MGSEVKVSELEVSEPKAKDSESELKAKDPVLCVVQKYGDKSQLVISNPINPDVFDSKSEKVKVSESEAKVVQGVLPFLSSNQAKVSESEAKDQFARMFDAAQKNSESEEVDLSDSENEDAKVSGPEVKISEPETKE